MTIPHVYLMGETYGAEIVLQLNAPMLYQRESFEILVHM